MQARYLFVSIPLLTLPLYLLHFHLVEGLFLDIVHSYLLLTAVANPHTFCRGEIIGRFQSGAVPSILRHLLEYIDAAQYLSNDHLVAVEILHRLMKRYSELRAEFLRLMIFPRQADERQHASLTMRRAAIYPVLK